MTINITAIRTNGSPITENFNLAYHFGSTDVAENTDRMIAKARGWATDRSYGGIVRIFMNREQRTEGFDAVTGERKDAIVSRTYEFETVDDFARGMKAERIEFGSIVGQSFVSE